MYAYGGLFASGKTYAELLADFESDQPISPNKQAAISAESRRTDLPSTQEQMRNCLERGVKRDECAQMELLLVI
jgi:hypothetical protein